MKTLASIIEWVYESDNDEEKQRLLNSLYINIHYQTELTVFFRYFWNSWRYTKSLWMMPVSRLLFCLKSSLDMCKQAPSSVGPPLRWTDRQKIDYYRGAQLFMRIYEGSGEDINFSSKEEWTGYTEYRFKFLGR